jgi:hypothetical protein
VTAVTAEAIAAALSETGLTQMGEGHELTRAGWEAMAAAQLRNLLPDRREALEAARDAAAAAEAAVGPERDGLARCQREVDLAEAAAAQIAEEAASEDRMTRLRAKGSAAAAAQEVSEAIAAREAQREALHARQLEVTAAVKAAVRAAEDVAVVEEAAAGDVFASPLGRATGAWMGWVLYSGTWFGWLGAEPGSEEAGAVREIIMFALHQTGLGREIEERVEKGVRAEIGQPDSPAQMLPDGTIIQTPQRMIPTRREAEQHLAPVPDGALPVLGARAGIGAGEGAVEPGIPGQTFPQGFGNLMSARP